MVTPNVTHDHKTHNLCFSAADEGEQIVESLFSFTMCHHSQESTMFTAERGEMKLTRNYSKFKTICGVPLSLCDDEGEDEDYDTIETTMPST